MALGFLRIDDAASSATSRRCLCVMEASSLHNAGLETQDHNPSPAACVQPSQWFSTLFVGRTPTHTHTLSLSLSHISPRLARLDLIIRKIVSVPVRSRSRLIVEGPHSLFRWKSHTYKEQLSLDAWLDGI